MFRVSTVGGRQLTGAGNVLVVTEVGVLRLDELASSGARQILANGIPPHQDREWLANQRRKGSSVREIAEAADVSYHTIRKWLRKHDLQFSSDERNFKKGASPWNAGVSGYRLTHRNYSPEGRERIRVARSGHRSNFWRGGVTNERASIGAWTTRQASTVHAKYDYTCQACASRGGRLHAHHVIPVWHSVGDAFEIDNLVTVCAPCHREIHSSIDEELSFMSIMLGADPPPLPAPSGAAQGERRADH